MTDEDYEQLRSERDALAKRVGELESTDFMAYTNELAAETARLRAENERDGLVIRSLERSRLDLTASLTAAQDRVRELEKNNARLTEVSMARARLLEAALSSTVRALHEHGHKQEASTFYRYLPPLGTKQPGPITRPACVPADCQHFEQLPSGLWAWVKDDTVYIEDRNMPDEPWFIQSHWPTRDDAFLGVPRAKRAVSEPDFLAARELGKKWLGWE